MRMIFGLVLILGIGLAGFAVYMARDYISQHQAQLAKERAARAQMITTVDVFVATRHIRYGERLTKEDVAKVRWPEKSLPEGAFQTLEELFPKGEDVPRSVMRTMERHEPVLAAKVTEAGALAGISARLSTGMRAFAVRVDVSSGVSGFLRPGDRVDVYWTGSVESLTGGMGEVTKLIEAGVDVIAIDQSADEDNANPTVARTVTVEVSPRQVAALTQAQATGRLSLSLVGVADDTLASPVEMNQRDLLGIEEQQVVEVEEERVCTIRTRRGADVVEIPIPCTN